MFYGHIRCTMYYSILLQTDMVRYDIDIVLFDNLFNLHTLDIECREVHQHTSLAVMLVLIQWLYFFCYFGDERIIEISDSIYDCPSACFSIGNS